MKNKAISDYSDSELIELLGAERVLRLAGSIRGRRQTPHAGPGRPTIATKCPKCGKLQPSVAAAAAHCKGKQNTDSKQSQTFQTAGRSTRTPISKA